MKVYYKFNPIEKDDSPKTGDTKSGDQPELQVSVEGFGTKDGDI